MLLNLTQDICVSRHTSAQVDRWICYSPCPLSKNGKRITWKKNTGLLTTEGMLNWLHHRYPDETHARAFSHLVTK